MSFERLDRGASQKLASNPGVGGARIFEKTLDLEIAEPDSSSRSGSHRPISELPEAQNVQWLEMSGTQYHHPVGTGPTTA